MSFPHRCTSGWSRRGRAIGIVSACTIALTLATAQSASADVTNGENREYVVAYDASQLAAAASTPGAHTTSLVDRFLLSRARDGVLSDAKSVRVAMLPDPAFRDRNIELVWHATGKPQGLFLAHDTNGEPGASSSALGFSFVEDRTAGSYSLVTGGSGYGNATSVSGAYLYSSGCADIYFTSGYGPQHHMITCYQKYARSGTDYWIYNRHTAFNKASTPVGLSAYYVDFTIRSRPWRGYESRVWQMLDWAPAQPSNHCGSATASISAGPASISFPVSQCTSVTPLANASQKMFGMDFNGRASQRYMRLDAAGAFRASNTTVVPIFADYNWVEVRACTLTNCGDKVHAQWDSGW